MFKWLKRIFHRHDWATIGRVEGVTAHMGSLLFRQNWDVEGRIVLQRCRKCPKWRSYWTDGINKEDVDVDGLPADIRKQLGLA